MKRILKATLAILLVTSSINPSYAVTSKESIADIFTKMIITSRAMMYDDYSILHTSMDTLKEGYQYTETRLFESGVVYKVVGIGGDGIRDLDIIVTSEKNVEIAKDTKNDNAPEVGFSLYETQRCTITVKAYDTEAGKEYDDNLFFIMVLRK